MQDLSERQKLILTLIVHEHSKTAQPVGSKYLVDQYNLNMSSATVRNEFVALTEMGYLRQPYTSAGRVPTEDGYRYFVGRLLRKTDLSDATRRTISHQFYQTRHDIEQWMRLAASILAQQTKAASVVTAPHPDEARLKHVELIATRGRQVLMVLVMMGGQVHQHIMTLSEPVLQQRLSFVADFITNTFQGMDAASIHSLLSKLENLEKDVTELLTREMSQVSTDITGEVYMDGLMNVLGEPEFADVEDARRALRVLEERSLLRELLTRSSVLSDHADDVQVLIGGEGIGDELRQCSLILARYGSPGMAMGALGVLGPMRMSYGRSISMVRFLSELLSDMVNETLVE